ncbi:MAG TPA: hypothetical protein EYG85_07115 [Crocinitomix sp.]|nr:hypothetical protein [Crocinitomix sp.]
MLNILNTCFSTKLISNIINRTQVYNYYWVTTTYDTLGYDSPYTYTPPTTPGNYTIYMIGYDQCYRLDTIPVNVIVNEIPTPSFTFNPPSGCVPLSVGFLSTTIVDESTATFTWTFGDGNYSTNNSANNVYTESECYDITLEVLTAEGCYGSTTYIDTLCIYEDPIPGFYWNPTQPTVLNPSIQVIDVSENAETYNYDFNGEGYSNEQNPYFTFNDISS